VRAFFIVLGRRRLTSTVQPAVLKGAQRNLIGSILPQRDIRMFVREGEHMSNTVPLIRHNKAAELSLYTGNMQVQRPTRPRI
jgi:hypothetical protein